MATLTCVDVAPGRLVWGKVGQWPWWPCKIVDVDEVPSKVLREVNHEDVEARVWVQFFEDPPKYQLLDDKKVRPWYANREKLSRNPKVADAVIDAEEHEQTLTADLQCDGNVVEPEAPAEPKQKRAKAEKKAPASRRASLEEADKAEEGDVGSGESAQTIVFLKRALGKALLSNDSGETVSVLRQLTEQRPNEASIRKLELGKIATHLSSSDHPEVREAATELLRQLVSVFVVGKAKP